MGNVNMAAYGLQKQHAAYIQARGENYTAARILSQEKGAYRIISEAGEQSAAVSGRFMHGAKSASDFPAVGDFVVIGSEFPQDRAVIHDVLPRKSVFIRKAAGTGCTEQAIAANIDTVFICMSMNSDFNLRRLERYLSVAWDSGASPVIVFTKSDLCPDPGHFLRSAEPIAVGTDMIAVSSMEPDGCKKLLSYIQEGMTAALVGSSGVGKSTLINRLLGENRLDTNELRRVGKGRHTTTRRELFLLKQGGMIIDTPGMRELGLWSAGHGFDQSFSDIEALAAMCRFHNCSHTNEPHCAVRAAVESGALPAKRLQSYLKLKSESMYAGDPEGYLAVKKQKFRNIAKINRRNQKDRER